MSHHKTARIAPSARRKTFVINADPLASAMRFCKNCVAFHQSCQMSDTLEKCMGCNAFGRFCDLYVLSVVIQRLHRERMKLRKKMRAAQAAAALAQKKNNTSCFQNYPPKTSIEIHEK